MRLLNRLLGCNEDGKHATQHTVCSHPKLAPMWENVADIGLRERISRYRCIDCMNVFEANEWEALTKHGSARTIAA